ncbi:MAG: substrate-binding domain-containing protein [Spirochaetales bacterium]
MNRALFVLLLLVLIAVAASGGGVVEERTRLRLATTTSTESSGLLAELLPPFERANNVIVDVIAVGTGAALELGRNGDVDVLMVHAPELEEQFVREGYGVGRVGFMYNDFVILGSESDPAGIAGTADVAAAFEAIAESESLFISRGDNSGTHNKELAIWDKAGISPEGSWYREAGQGMGAVITIANNELAYTLTDRGTYLAYRGDIDMGVLVEGDPLLFNPYAAIAVSPDRHPETQIDLAQDLIAYFVSDEGQQIIGNYRVEGESLFTPDAD